jgi:ribulose-phosphate 3-epimerase
MQIFPSIICGDILNLEKEISTLDPICDGYHIDVMDDHFVPNLTIGPDIVNAIANKTALPCQVHLMVDNPQVWPNRLKLKSSDILIFHIETISSNKSLFALISSIKNMGWQVGLAINPNTTQLPETSILATLDQILIMSVNPGHSGQKFIPEVMEKVKNLVNIKKRYCNGLQITIDGGIDKHNIKMLSNLEIDIFCVGSAVFSAKDHVKALQALYTL